MKTLRCLLIASTFASALTGVSFLVTVGASAQGGRGGAPGPAANVPLPNDVSGFWELRWDMKHVPTALLAGRVTPAVLRAQAKNDGHATRWCNYLGVPWMMYGTQRPLNIVQGSIETIIVPESGMAFPRHIYLDGRKPAEEALDPSTNGFSTGQWDGTTFVVTTVAFSDKGLTGIPGGGFRTERSRLTERFRLAAGGAQLWVTSTWEDKTVFRTPQTYEMRYQRVTGDYRPRPTMPCDALDDERAQFLGFKPIAAPADPPRGNPANPAAGGRGPGRGQAPPGPPK